MSSRLSKFGKPGATVNWQHNNVDKVLDVSSVLPLPSVAQRSLSPHTSTHNQLFLPGASTNPKSSLLSLLTVSLWRGIPAEVIWLTPLSKNAHCHISHRNESGGFPGFQMNTCPHTGKTCLPSLWHSSFLLFLPLPKISFFTPVLPNSMFLLGGILKALCILF